MSAATADLSSLRKTPLANITFKVLSALMPERQKRAVVVSTLFAYATRSDAQHDAELYKHLNSLFRLSSSESVLLYPTTLIPDIWSDKAKSCLMQAIAAANEIEARPYINTIVQEVPKRLRYGLSSAQTFGDILKLVEYLRERFTPTSNGYKQVSFA